MTLKHVVKKAIFLIILYWIFLLLNPFPTPAYAADEKACDTYEEKLLHSINQYRDRHNTPPLLFDRTLHILAEAHSQYMRGSDKLGHTNFEDRYKQCKRNICVENVGWNYMTPEDQFEAWRESKGHSINMLNKEIRRAGISKVGSYVTFFACD
jgi:uncharacterized protein YkwD